MKLIPVMMLGLSAAIAISGCSSTPGASTAPQESAAPKKLTLLHHFKSGSLDPHNDWTPVRAGVTETLMRLDAELRIQPWLAEKWESVDERTWRFTLREGVTFHDGTKLDAAAAKASLERGAAVSKAIASSLKIASMEASGQTLTIVTTEPHPGLLSELVNPYSSIISVEAEKKAGREAFNLAPVGTGPFKVKSFKPNIEVQLERNDTYWDGKAKLQEVTYRFNEDGNVRALALQAKEADIATQLPAETVDTIKGNSALEVHSVPSLRVHFVLYNQKKPHLQDIRVRKALDLLLNRESVAKDVMLGHATPANGPFNTRLPFASQEKVQPLDIEKAKQLLVEAGYTPGTDGKLAKDGKPLTLELITYKARPELPLIAQLLQSDAAKAGVTIQIKTVENADVHLRENKEWDLATYSNLTAPRGDGAYFLNTAMMPGGSLNAGSINSEKLSEIVGRLNRASAPDERIGLTREATAVIHEETPHSYAVFPNLIVGTNKRVVDWKPGAEEYYIITKQMDVK